MITKPIQVGHVTLGQQEADIKPFERSDIDYSKINQMRKADPTYGHAQIPDAVINSCSECCMESINGQPNLRGKLHRKLVKSCSQCPVGRASDILPARDGQGRTLYIHDAATGKIRPMTESEMVNRAMDGQA